MPEGPSTLTEEQGLERALARLSSEALLSSCRLYHTAKKLDKAAELAVRSREAMRWAPAVSVRSQQELVRVRISQNDRSAVIMQMWRLADEYPVASNDGVRVYNETLNAPIEIVRLVRADGDSVELHQTVDRALSFYGKVRSDWERRLPALIADIHTASLLEDRGNWREAGTILETALSSYPDSILAEDERARIALTAGHLFITDNRDLERATQYFEESRSTDPKTVASLDAALQLAQMARTQGRQQDALEIYREVAVEATDDLIRAPVARYAVAITLKELNRWDDALAELRSLRATFPTSRQGLEVPFVIARHYEEIGESELAKSVLQRSECEFQEIIDSHGGTREHGLAVRAFRALIRSRKVREDWDGAVEGLLSFSRDYGGNPDAALALLEAADICQSKLDDPSRSDELLRLVEQSYPNTRFAEAAARLRGGSSGDES